LTHGTFVCANCAVVHRELGHAVKNSATDLFAPEEISALCASTNLAANRLWLARRGPGDCAIDPGANRLERRHFLECKYLLRQWFSEAGACAPLERPSESDFATDASDIGSPLPAMPDIEPGMGPMCEAERCRAASSPRQSRVSAAETFALCKSCARAPPVQIGERPPEKSWQTKQLPVRYQQRLWSVREKP
jgi:hypothetical protein